MATKWFFKQSGKTVGPISNQELVAKVRSGEVVANSWVRKDDSPWFPANEVNGLFEAAFRDQPDRIRRERETEYRGD